MTPNFSCGRTCVIHRLLMPILGLSLIMFWGCQPVDTASIVPDSNASSAEADSNSSQDEHSDPAHDEGADHDQAESDHADGDHDHGTDGEHDEGDHDGDSEHQAAAASGTSASGADDSPIEVVLGNPLLTSGIPGEGSLTLEEIKIFINDPNNHRPLSVSLPLGLSAAQENIVGIKENPMTIAKIELGRQLYFDTRLSKDNTVSCASCHAPDNGYAKDTKFGVGIDDQEGGRNSPVAYNRIISGAQFWDGRADSLEAQAVGPIENPIEMGNTHENCVNTLAGIEGYKVQFEKIFPDGVTIDNVGKAIATFERTLVTAPAGYDYLEVVRGIESQWGEDLDELEEEDPEVFAEYSDAQKVVANLSESTIRGRDLFFSEKTNCTACHAGANFADELYHNLGVGMEVEKPDLGRFAETNNDIDRGAFKTPTVRNVAMTGPYMHDGSQKTLEEVVEWYAKGGHANPFLSEKVKKLELTDQDKADLVAFMKEGLTSDLPPVETGRLPQ